MSARSDATKKSVIYNRLEIVLLSLARTITSGDTFLEYCTDYHGLSSLGLSEKAK